MRQRIVTAIGQPPTDSISAQSIGNQPVGLQVLIGTSPKGQPSERDKLLGQTSEQAPLRSPGLAALRQYLVVGGPSSGRADTDSGGRAPAQHSYTTKASCVIRRDLQHAGERLGSTLEADRCSGQMWSEPTTKLAVTFTRHYRRIGQPRRGRHRTVGEALFELEL